MKRNPLTVNELIEQLQQVEDKNLPVFAFHDGSEQTFYFQEGANGIAYDKYEKLYIDESISLEPAVYLLVGRYSNEP